MTLAAYLQTLHLYIGPDLSNQEFIPMLLMLIMAEPSTPEEIQADEDEKYYPYKGDDSEKDFLGRIYGGSKFLPKQKAKMIKTHYEGKELKEAINSLDGTQKRHLVAAMQGLGATACNMGNLADICDEAIRLLIDAAVLGIKEIDSDSLGKVSETMIPVYDDSDLKPDFGVTLLAEARQHCPAINCLNPLYIEENGKSGFRYNIVQINSRLKRHDVDNLIALCPDCASRYMFHMSPEKVSELEDIKMDISSMLMAFDSMSDEALVSGVKRVIQKIGNIPVEQVLDLNYNPSEVIKKMDKQDPALFFKIRGYVSTYFPDVEGIFKNMEAENSLDYEKFCYQMKFKYRDLNSRGLSQTQIFETLASWMSEETHENIAACEVVVSFFVQKCEVFDVIAE